MVHVFAEKYGWTIEYVMNLTVPQITCMMEGMEEIYNMQDNKKDQDKKNEDDKNTDNKPKVNDLAGLLGALGGSVKMSEKAKKAYTKLVKGQGKK